MAHAVNAGARLDRLPISPFHYRIFALVGAGMFFDGYDLYVAGGVLAFFTAILIVNAEDRHMQTTVNGWSTTLEMRQAPERHPSPGRMRQPRRRPQLAGKGSVLAKVRGGRGSWAERAA